MKKLLIVVGMVVVFSGCTSKQLYEFGQGYQESQCTKYANTELQYNDCVNMNEKSFEEYERERNGGNST